MHRSKINTLRSTFIHSITGSGLHHLWHYRLCHAGKFVTDNIAKVTDRVPSLKRRHTFFSCDDCSSGKMTNQIKGYSKKTDRTTEQGGRFNMDYALVRGEKTTKNENGPLITSRAGYNCYLLIVDGYSRHLWIFLLLTNLHLSPPLHHSFPITALHRVYAMSAQTKDQTCEMYWIQKVHPEVRIHIRGHWHRRLIPKWSRGVPTPTSCKHDANHTLRL